MKINLIATVKHYKVIYKLYSFLGSAFLRIIKPFISTDHNLILFISFGGRKFDDSPKAIYEAMCNDERFSRFNFIWAFQNPEEFVNVNSKKIKTDTLEYYITALKARCWITNSTVERGLNFKGKKTLYFNTWHGTPIKKMGIDINNDSKKVGNYNSWGVDIMTAQSQYEVDIYSRVFNIKKENFVITGLPRNDDLFALKNKPKKEFLTKLGINDDKKIILYAPTYREYLKYNALNCILKPPIDLKKWKEELGEEYIVLLRAHYEVSDLLIDDNGKEGFVLNVSKYPNVNDLMLSSDILISDYSSMFFDYSILERPMLHFTYDYPEYEEKRGVYFDIRNEICGSNNEDDLLNQIKSLDYNLSITKSKNFKNKYVESCGKATTQALNIILSEIN